jgi:hypothetical protein
MADVATMTVRELQRTLDQLGVAWSKSSKKPELQQLVLDARGLAAQGEEKVAEEPSARRQSGKRGGEKTPAKRRVREEEEEEDPASRSRQAPGSRRKTSSKKGGTKRVEGSGKKKHKANKPDDDGDDDVGPAVVAVDGTQLVRALGADSEASRRPSSPVARQEGEQAVHLVRLSSGEKRKGKPAVDQPQVVLSSFTKSHISSGDEQLRMFEHEHSGRQAGPPPPARPFYSGLRGAIGGKLFVASLLAALLAGAFWFWMAHSLVFCHEQSLDDNCILCPANADCAGGRLQCWEGWVPSTSGRECELSPQVSAQAQGDAVAAAALLKRHLGHKLCGNLDTARISDHDLMILLLGNPTERNRSIHERRWQAACESLAKQRCIGRDADGFFATCDEIRPWGCVLVELAAQHVYYIAGALLALVLVFIISRKSGKP